MSTRVASDPFQHHKTSLFKPVDVSNARALCNQMAEEKTATWEQISAYWAEFGAVSGIEEIPTQDKNWCFAPFIETLDLSNTDLTDAQLVQLLPKFPNLISLSLSENPNFTGETFRFLRLPHIQELNVSRCPGLDDGGLFYISYLPSIFKLNLSECNNVTHEGIRYLYNLRHLIELRLVACIQLGDSALLALGGCSNLTLLDLSGCYQITNRGISALSRLKLLSSLDLTQCFAITNEAMAHLPSKLKILKLNYCHKLTNTCLERLRNLPRLEVLELEACPNISGIAILNADFRPEVQIEFSVGHNPFAQIDSIDLID